MTLLAGASTLIVGTRSPLGARIVSRLLEHGAQITGVDRDPVTREVEPLLNEHIQADMSTTSGADRALEHAAREMGGIDILVSGAAVQHRGRVWQTDDDTWDAVMSGTMNTFFHTLRAGLPYLASGGAVVALSSVNATLAHPGMAAYAAAKGAVEALVRQAALDCAPRGVRVNAVAPAFVDGGPEQGQFGYPGGRTPTAAEVADTVVFLASSMATGITGCVIPVDAGLSITSPAAVTRPTMVTQLKDGAWEPRPERSDT